MLLFLEFYGNRAIIFTDGNKVIFQRESNPIDLSLLFKFIIYFTNNTWGRSKVGWDPAGGRSRLFEWAWSLKKSDFGTF